jgi:hypothetical protein
MTSSQREQARYIMRRYLEQAEAAQPRWHYAQFRPVSVFGNTPSHGGTTDCSGLTIAAYYWADLWCKFPVRSPGGYGYTGYGNTGSILYENRRRRVPLDRKFFVGDMALFGPSVSDTEHVTICRRNGDTMSSLWTSHGSEQGPIPTRLQYRPDLICVVRSEALA